MIVRLLELLGLRKTPRKRLEEKLRTLQRQRVTADDDLDVRRQSMQHLLEDIRRTKAERDADEPTLQKTYDVKLAQLVKSFERERAALDLYTRKAAQLDELIRVSSLKLERLDNPADAKALWDAMDDMGKVIDDMTAEDAVVQKMERTQYSYSAEATVPCEVSETPESADLEAKLSELVADRSGETAAAAKTC